MKGIVVYKYLPLPLYEWIQGFNKETVAQGFNKETVALTELKQQCSKSPRPSRTSELSEI